jgi:biotin carboxyl carrier protein
VLLAGLNASTTPSNNHTKQPQPNQNKQGDTVRANQTVAYVEQLGTYVEIKTPTGGEVARFKAADGEPVEYGQVVLELAPTFGSASPSS